MFIYVHTIIVYISDGRFSMEGKNEGIGIITFWHRNQFIFRYNLILAFGSLFTTNLLEK